MTDLTSNWTFQSPLILENEMDDGNVGMMMSFEDITIEELEAEFDRLQKRPVLESQETNRRISALPHEAPLTAQFHEIYNLEEIAAIRKGSLHDLKGRTQRYLHNRVEQPGARDPADILRSYQAF